MNKKNVGLKTKRETVVTFLKDPLVSFVSLVKHGANNTPFRVVKANKGGSHMGKVIQAIMVPKDSAVDIKELMGTETRDDVVKEEGTYKLYEQVEKSAVDPTTKALVVVDPDNHVYAVTYDLLVDKKEKENEPEQKNTTQDIKEVGFYDVWEELMALGDMVSGVMSQSLASPTDRKDTVLKAIDNFRGFCEAVFSQAKSGEVFTPARKIGEVAVGDLTTLKTQVSELLKTQNKEEGTMFDFETKEDLGTFISETVVKTLEKKETDAATLKEVADKKDAEQARDDNIKDMETTIQKLTETVEKISGTVINTKADEEEGVKDKKEQQPDGRYTGLFSKLQTSPGSLS